MWLHDATIEMTAKLVPLMRWTPMRCNMGDSCRSSIPLRLGQPVAASPYTPHMMQANALRLHQTAIEVVSASWMPA